MKVIYPNDTTPFIKAAITEVVKTLFEAIFLVFLVMWLFLGNIRATLIPTIAVPVVILGTFAMLGFLGYSINMLTMFAMVLAIGLLVDDAIVVVENVERIMSEEGLSPKEATRKSMDQITTALIGIGLVLSAVFGPMAFFPGSTGVIYRQFSVTIIVSMLLSVVVALILTPVLCASLLKPVPAGHEPSEYAIFFLRPFFRWFDRIFFKIRDYYLHLVHHSISKKLRYLVVFVLIVTALGFLYLRMPTSYLPDEEPRCVAHSVDAAQRCHSGTDQGGDEYGPELFPGKRKRGDRVLFHDCRSRLCRKGTKQWHGFYQAEGLGPRERPDLRAKAIAARASKALSGTRNARVYVFPPRLSPSWARPRGLTLCCWTWAVWGTRP